MNSIFSPNGYAQELRNCLSEAEAHARARSYQNLAALPALIAAGKHVVIRHVPYFCRATDAFAGEIASISSVHESRERAEWSVEMSGLDSEFGHDADSPRYEILPHEAVLFETVRAEVADEIPF